MTTSRILLWLALLAVLAPFASEVQAASDGGDSATGALEEVVVTARKREENLATTPLSVTAFTASALEKMGIDRVTDIGSHVANLSIVGGQGGGDSQTQISIRGVGQSDFILTTDQSVGMYVDGVYYPRSLGSTLYCSISRTFKCSKGRKARSLAVTPLPAPCRSLADPQTTTSTRAPSLLPAATIARTSRP